MRGDREIRPANSLILVMDPMGDPPATMAGASVASTETCVAIGTLSVSDGPTVLALTDQPPGAGLSEAYDGSVATPSRQLVIRGVDGVVYATHPVASGRTRVRVWTNDPSEPDRIEVMLD